jgi:hypothetical protein
MFLAPRHTYSPHGTYRQTPPRTVYPYSFNQEDNVSCSLTLMLVIGAYKKPSKFSDKQPVNLLRPYTVVRACNA